MKQTILKLSVLLFVLSLSTFALAQSAPETITNNATVSSPTTDLNQTNNSASTTDKLCYKADLTSTIADTLTLVTPLSDNTYNATITSAGPSTTTELEFEFTYNPLDYSSVTLPTVSSGLVSLVSTTPVGSLTTLKYKVTGLNLANGQTLNIAIPTKATANPSTSVVTSFNTNPTGPANTDPACTMQDPALTNNPSSDTTNGRLEADLSIVKTSSGGASSLTGAIGSMDSKTSQNYTLTATNNGPSTAEAPITIVDTLPLQVTPTGISGSTCTPGPGSTPGLVCTWDSATRKMTFTLPTSLPNGSNVVANIPVLIN
jgi:large repetitive protein